MIVVVMGVAGSGKTLIGRMLADELRWRFLDADDFHSRESIAKMASGIPLTDHDREPWLAAIRRAISDPCVLACSALTGHFRAELRRGFDMRFVLLSAPFDVIAQRVGSRRGHFFDPRLLQSQFDTLETPSDETIIDGAQAPATIVESIREKVLGPRA